ncbi:MAG: hypothetical protein JWR55_3186 [Aeromicrobium sp.]|nr:hypothetical protein [Aeromicrobium sp.]
MGPHAYRETVTQRRLPAEIYWRRRLLLVALLIALAWGVLQLTDRGDDAEPAAATRTTSAPTATATPTPTPTPSAAATTPEPQDDGLVDVALTTADTPCDPEEVRVTPTVRSGQLTKGPVDIGLVVSSTAKRACTLTPDDAEAIAVISANGTPIWDSTVCKSSLLTGPVEISPQWSTLASIQWTGRGSGSRCTTNEGWATPGKYTIQIGTLGGEPGKTTFTLDPRPAAPKTPAAATPSAAAPAATPAPATPAATTPAPAATPTG